MRGFTLIETLIYIAIFGIIMSGILSGVWAFIASADRSQTQALLETEGNFLMQKMACEILHSENIREPLQNSESSDLAVTSDSGTHVELYLADSTLMRTENSLSLPLSSNAVSLSNLLFAYSDPGNGNPKSVQTSFEISATTSDGQARSENFSETEYFFP